MPQSELRANDDFGEVRGARVLLPPAEVSELVMRGGHGENDHGRPIKISFLLILKKFIR
jgi:hypothetical protein